MRVGSGVTSTISIPNDQMLVAKIADVAAHRLFLERPRREANAELGRTGSRPRQSGTRPVPK
jgi:hypothetical protein